MSVREIFQSIPTAKAGHVGPNLTQPGVDVGRANLPLALEVVQDLLDTMAYQPLCVGLAANQIGSDLNIAVIEDPGSEPIVLINPELVSTTGKKDKKRESCMSVWGLTGEVERRHKATVSYLDINLDPREQTFEGFVARVVQHELDHLKGVLYSSRVQGKLTPTNLFEGYSPVPKQ